VYSRDAGRILAARSNRWQWAKFLTDVTIIREIAHSLLRAISISSADLWDNTKTITFRTIASAMDFSTNYVVVGDLAIAVGLSAFAFVVGPFVHFGHEKAWDHYAPPREGTLELSTATEAVAA
jgi:uncharacterized membrane protein